MRRRLIVAALAFASLGTLIVGTPPAAVTAVGGVTFDPRPGSVSFGDGSAFPSVVAAGDGSYHAVARVQPFGQYIQHRVSENGGISWQTTALLTSPDQGATRPRIAADGDTVAITFIGGYCTSPGICGEAPFLAVSRDGGRRFNGPVRLGPAAFDVAVAVAGSAVWVAWEAGNTIEIRGTGDAGSTFPVSRTVPGVGFGPDVAAAGATVVIAWNTFDGPRAIVGRNSVLGEPQVLGAQGSFLPWRGATAVEARGAAHVVVQTDDAVYTRSAAPAQTSFEPRVDVFAAGANASISARDGLVAVGLGARQGRAYVSASSDGGATFSAPEPVADMPGGGVFADVTVARRATDRPQARFDWSVPPRYAADAVGRRLPAVSAGTGELTVDLDGCQSLPPAGKTIAEYRWTVDGTDLSDTDCEVSLQATDGDRLEVRMEVTASDGTTHATTGEVTPVDHLIVSIGDSIASGEGNPHTDATLTPFLSPTWEDRACHRSDTAGPARAAAELEDADPRSSVTFVHLACSGASMLDTPDAAGSAPSGPDDPDTGGLLDPYRGIEHHGDPARPTQIDQMETAVGNRDVDALLVSIGANDIRFSEVVKECIASSPLDPRPCHQSATATNVSARLATLPTRYEQLATRLDQAGIADADVYITEYFDPTVDDLGLANLRCIAETETVGDLAETVGDIADIAEQVIKDPRAQHVIEAVGYAATVIAYLTAGGVVTDDETAWARTAVVGRLNQAVQAAALTHGWTYVGGIAERFDRHGYCASDPWVVTLGETFQRQHDSDGAFHPDANGHEVYGDAITASVGTSLSGALTPASFPPKVALGDIYVTVSNSGRVWAGIMRDTGGQPDLIDLRQMDRLTGGDGYQGPGTPAADDSSAVTAWWQVSNESGALPSAMLGQITLAENVGVRSVTVAQAPADGTSIVAGRQSVVLATIDARIAGSQTIDITTEVVAEHSISGAVRTVVAPITEQVTLAPGRNDVLLPASSTFTIDEFEKASANVTVSEAIGPGGDPSDNFATSSSERIPTARETRALRAIVLPANVGGGAVGCPAVARTARRMAAYASEALPVAGDGIEVGLACTAITIADNSEPTLLDTLSQLDHLARLTAQDVMVAVVPEGWLRTAADGAIGVAVPSLRAVIVEQTAPAEALAHEIAHTFGVLHRSAAAEGVRISTRTAPRGIDWMNPVAVPKVWTGGATWDALFTKIGDPSRLPRLPDPTHPGVWVRGTVEQLPNGDWVVGPAEWTPANGSEPVPAIDPLMEELEIERLTVEQRSASGDLLDETDVPLRPASGLYGSGETPPIGPTGGLFATRIDLDPDATLLRLVRNGVPVDERAVGAAPTVTVTAPVAGITAARGSTLAVAWDAIDTDSPPSDLTADILVSTDGVAWEPLGVGVAGAAGTAAVTVPADLDGTAVRVRVIVSDGVRAGQDDSEEFTVDGGGTAVEERVVFVRQPTWQGGHLFTMAPDGTDLQPIDLPTEHGYDFGNASFWPVQWRTPHLGSDGRLYMVGNYVTPEWDPQVGSSPPAGLTGLTAIFSSLPDGSDLRKIGGRGGIDSYGEPTTRCPETSPSGTKLAWWGYPPDGPLDPSRQSIVIGNTDGAGQQVLLQSGASFPASVLNSTWVTPEDSVRLRPQGCPRWSPDGTRVAVLASIQYRHTFPGRAFPANVYLQAAPIVIDVATGAVRVLADQPNHGLRYYADGGTSFDPYDYWNEIDWIDDDTLYSELYEASGLCGYPYSCTSTYTRTRVDVTDGSFTRVSTMPSIAPRDGVKVSPIDPTLIYGAVDQYNPTGSTGRDFALHDLATDTLEVFPVAPDFSRDIEFDWGFMATGGGPATDPVVLPSADPVAAATTGGPYQAVQFESIRLDAGASDAFEANAAVEWDLDGDGEFDDAIGVRPDVVFDAVGTRTIRVRIISGAVTVVSDPSEVFVTAAPPNEPLPPVLGADGPVAPVVVPTDLSVTIPAGATTAVALQPAGTRFAVVDTSGAAGLLDFDVPAASPDAAHPLTTGPDGVVLVTPAPGFSGVATFLVANPVAPTQTATVTVTVDANEAPIADDDARTVTVAQVTSFAADELLANDRDPDGGALRVVAVRAATNGDAYLDAAGTVFVSPSTVGSGEAEVVVADAEGAMAVSRLRLTVTAAPTPPGSPTGLSAHPGDRQVALDWLAPASSEPITGYEVQVRTLGGQWGPSVPVPAAAQALGAGPDSTSAIVDGLVNGTEYEFRVAARSSLGLGGYSASVSAIPTAPAPPDTTPPDTTQPATGITVTPPATTTPIDPLGIELPSTGSEILDLLAAATAVLLIGAVVVLGVRRRPRRFGAQGTTQVP